MAYTVVYVLEEPPESYAKALFLAGPMPRSDDVPSWRPEALRLLKAAGYDGVIFVPEVREGAQSVYDEHRVEWEERCLHMADCILFWVPRVLATMPGFTTNDEWGVWKTSGKVVFGAPAEAVHVRYQRFYCDKLGVPQSDTLDQTVNLALQKIGAGIQRTAAEREVPLCIWRTSSFQQWYMALCAADNRLEHARMEWSLRASPNRQSVLFWALTADIYVAAEGRRKANEIVLGRPDVSSVLLYRRAAVVDDTTVVLVREFRSSVSNADGFVYELPGGSSFELDDPLSVAVNEVREETGLHIAPSRFKREAVCQVAATLPVHKSHLFSVELTEQEVDGLRLDAGHAHGEFVEGERTYVEVMTLAEIKHATSVDWSTRGMVLQVLS